MRSLHRGLRAEIAAILDVDQYTLEDTTSESPAPTEPTTTLLGNLIRGSLSHKEEVRTIYEFLPIVMLRIFGFSSGHGWLEMATEHSTKDRDALVRLIAPEGPIHTFCNEQSPHRDAKLDVASDMRYEFLRSNLPLATDRALEEGPAVALKKSVKDGPSFLAPFLASALRDRKDQVLFLTPLDYFYLCMIASPTMKKATGVPLFTIAGRRVRRSSLLPSTRALYNQTIASYASALNGMSRVDSDSIFMAVCLDYFFIPWASATPVTELPIASTATAEAVASLMMALVPDDPAALDLDVDFRPSGIPEFLDWKMQTNTSALYRAAESMLESVFRQYESSAQPGPLIIYYRILALYIAPWKASIRKALAAGLFPKKKSSASANGNVRSSSMAAFTSTLSSINSHLVSTSGSPGNASSTKESVWREELRIRQKFVDDELLRLAIVKAANRRLPSSADGGHALALLSEAAVAARLNGNWDSAEKDQDLAEELRSCLFALRNQKSEHERENGRREKNYVNGLSSSMGLRLDGGGMFSGISGMVGVGRSARFGGISSMSRNSASGDPSGSSRKHIRDRRLSALRVNVNEEQITSNVWDRPISDKEYEFLVLSLYKVALWLEPRLGYVPNLRVLSRHLIVLSAVALFVAASSGYLIWSVLIRLNVFAWFVIAGTGYVIYLMRRRATGA